MNDVSDAPAVSTPPAARKGGRIQRFFFRAPIKLFDWKLDRLLGSRFLLLEHVGRRSGAQRRNVLEVSDVIDGHPVIASGFGTRSDWYHNITATPEVAAEAIPTFELVG